MRVLTCCLILGTALAAASDAKACASGARCLTAPASSEPLHAPGDVLSPGSFNVLLNSDYYGLPRLLDGTWYVTVDRRVLRIKPGTYEVLEDVTSQTNRAF